MCPVQKTSSIHFIGDSKSLKKIKYLMSVKVPFSRVGKHKSMSLFKIIKL